MRLFVRVAAVVLILAAGIASYQIWGSGGWSGRSAWGAPLVEEPFSGGSWLERWATKDGEFEIREGRLVCIGATTNTLLLRRQLTAPIAVEWTGEILPGASPGDLSAIWYKSATFDPLRPKVLEAEVAFRLQIGAVDNSYSCIIDKDGQYLAYSPYRLVTDRRQRIRVEIGEASLRVLVDGQEIMQHHAPFPLPAGWLGLYGHYAGKAFDDVRVFRQPLRPSVPATAVADWLAQQGRFAEAGDEYARVASDLERGWLAERARWLRAECLERSGDSEGARPVWASLIGTAFADRAALASLDERFRAGDHEGLFARLGETYRMATPEVRSFMAQRWATWVRALRKGKADWNLLVRYDQAHEAVFGDERVGDVEAVGLALEVMRPERVLEHFPQHRVECARALIMMGRAEDALARYGDQPQPYMSAMSALGRHEESLPGVPVWGRPMVLSTMGAFDRLVEEYPDNRVRQALALVALGRYEQIVSDYSDLTPIYAETLLTLGRVAEAEAIMMKSEDINRRFNFLVRTGHWAETANQTPWAPGREEMVRYLMAIDAFAAGDMVTGRGLLESYSQWCWASDSRAENLHLVRPFLLELDGQAGCLVKNLAAVREGLQEPWKTRLARWHALASGTVEAEPDSAIESVIAAMHADIAGDTATAVAGYQRYRARIAAGNEVVRRLAGWRLEKLAAP